MPWKMPLMQLKPSAYSPSRPAGGVKAKLPEPNGQLTVKLLSAAHRRPAGSVYAGPPELMRRIEMVLGSVVVRLTTAVPVSVGLATLAAVTVTVVGEATVAGAVYKPV